MTLLVTGSAGHLGEALVRTLRDAGREVRGLDRRPSPFTDVVGSITDRDVVRDALRGIRGVLHAATLHKPHVGTHTKQQFVDTNVSGTLNLLVESVREGVEAFVFTSTTSAFGRALAPGEGEPAVWITEDVPDVPKNVYGVTKAAAEGLCELVHRQHGLPCVALRTSRFFPEADDDARKRAEYDERNAKANEFLHRRVDLEDVVSAHLCALERAPRLPFGSYVVSATTPFDRRDLAELRADAPAVVARLHPEFVALYEERGWRMFPSIERVYVNARARDELGWRPRHDFSSVLARLRAGEDVLGPLSARVGSKGYHDRAFDDGPYPVDPR